jgi:hypothetical protein
MAARLARATLVAVLAWRCHGCHAILGPSEIDTNWKVLDSLHFAFHVRPGSFAEQNIATLIEVMDDQYAFALSALDIRYAGRISLFLYNNANDAGEPFGFERSGNRVPRHRNRPRHRQPAARNHVRPGGSRIESRHPAQWRRTAGHQLHE